MRQAQQQEIITLLSHHLGLNVETMGRPIIQRTIERERKKLGYDTDDEYIKHLNCSQQALASLIEAVVVPETNFFRHPESFEYLHQFIYTSKTTGHHKHPLRILSLPCSTGEEAYSIAITLLEAGLEHHQFQIEGADINQTALSFAQQGLYGQYSFRNATNFSPQPYLKKYFHETNQDSYQINADVKAQVKFCQKNLAEPLYISKTNLYDIIFCRNLLIYLHDTARAQAHHNLNHLLAPTGLLFVGFAETSLIDTQLFSFIDYPKAFAFQKCAASVPAYTKNNIITPNTLIQSKTSPSISDIPDRTISKSNHHDINHSQQTGSSQREDHQNRLPITIERMRILANQGKLSEALEACDTHLKNNPVNPDAYLLLGEIYQAQGSDERAAIAFQKVLYLDPNCMEAVVHLILLCEQQSKMHAAERLRQRLQRITSQTNSNKTLF